jgi:hypothetical protein
MAREKNWQFVWNHSYTASSTLDLNRYTMWLFAAVLTGNYGGVTGAGLWTLYASSDSVTAGTDSTDRWQLAGPYDGTKIVRGNGTAAHSWIVLKSPYVNGSYWYLVMSFNTSNDAYAKYSLSKVAPTGGSITATPYDSNTGTGTNTNGNSFSILGVEYYNVPITSVSPYNFRYIFGLAEDGQFYFCSWKVGVSALSTCSMFIPLEDYLPEDLYPVYFFWVTGTDATLGVNASQTNNQPLWDVSTIGGVARYIDGTTQSSGYSYKNIFLSYNGSGGMVGQYGATYSWKNKIVNFPIYVNITTYVATSYALIRGRAPDLFMTTSFPRQTVSATIFNTTTPPTGSVEYVAVGTLLIPAPEALVIS